MWHSGSLLRLGSLLRRGLDPLPRSFLTSRQRPKKKRRPRRRNRHQAPEQTRQDSDSGFPVPSHCFLMLPESKRGWGGGYKRGRSDAFLQGQGEDLRASGTPPRLLTDNEVILQHRPAWPQSSAVAWAAQPITFSDSSAQQRGCSSALSDLLFLATALYFSSFDLTKFFSQ